MNEPLYKLKQHIKDVNTGYHGFVHKITKHPSKGFVYCFYCGNGSCCVEEKYIELYE